MAVFCPDCGHVLRNAAEKTGDAMCAQCTRPLGDPEAVAARPVSRVWSSVSLAATSIFAGVVLLALSLWLLFPAHTRGLLASAGIRMDGEIHALGLHLRSFDILLAVGGFAVLGLLLVFVSRMSSSGKA